MTSVKTLLQIPLSPFTGYGNDGIDMSLALLRAGVDLRLIPTSVQAPIPSAVAQVLTREVKAPFDLGIVHVDPMSIEVKEETSSPVDVMVGWTMWEWTSMHLMPKRSTLRKRIKHFDAMVAYDAVTAEALKEYYDGPIVVQQGGYNPEIWPKVERDWHGDEFYFCQIGMLTSRKDPFVSIQAFGMAQQADPEFAKHARLMLKTNVPGLHSKMEDVYPGLRIFYDSWPQDLVREFYAKSHVLLAPSRGEGKNLPALEFLSSGGSVIATNWGGHRGWLHPDYAYPLDYELVSDDLRKPEVLNARASAEHMRDLMLHTFHNRAEVKRKGEIAAQIIPQMSSWDAAVRGLVHALADVPGGRDLQVKFDSAVREAEAA